MSDCEEHIDLNDRTRPIGLGRSKSVWGAETIIFAYNFRVWLAKSRRVSQEPPLAP